MGTLNLGTARTELLARGFDYLSAARANQMLNWAGQELNDAALWPWDETTTTQTAPWSPTDLKAVLGVLDTTNRQQLDSIDRRTLVDSFGDTTTTGTAMWYYLEGDVLKVYPVSTNSLSIRYLKRFAALSADVDTPPWPAFLDDVWVDLAVLRAMKDDDSFDGQGYQSLKQIVDDRLDRVRMTVLSRTLDRPASIVEVRGGEDFGYGS